MSRRRWSKSPECRIRWGLERCTDHAIDKIHLSIPPLDGHLV